MKTVLKFFFLINAVLPAHSYIIDNKDDIAESIYQEKKIGIRRDNMKIKVNCRK